MGWPATVREIDELASVFDKVIHVSCLSGNEVPVESAAYSNSKVEFVPIPEFGGSGLRKLSVIYYAPVIIWRVFKQLRRATYFQFRAPTSIGIYIIPLLLLFTNKKGWFKYAGNWIQVRPPLTYGLQRFILSMQHKYKVTINGNWIGQPKHCLSFENPCLDETNRVQGFRNVKQKNFQPPFIICFSGRLEEEKGALRILVALKDEKISKLISEVHFVGDGPDKSRFLKMSNLVSSDIQIQFHGFLPREDVFSIYKRSHFLLLPSTASEGFPKVIAEAANFGCVPVVSNISSIPQYVNASNGYVWDSDTDFTSFLVDALSQDAECLVRQAEQGHAMAADFTYANYLSRIQGEILNNAE